MTIKPLRAALNATGFLYYTWVVPGAIFVLICALIFRRFLADLPGETRSLFLVAGTCFVGGAIGMELVGGYYHDLFGYDNMTYKMIDTIEECLEMVGILVFIYALVSYMGSHVRDV